jgi:hypothetical protein
MLRALKSMGIFTQTSPEVFGNTPMVMATGKERTAGEFRELLAQGGFELERESSLPLHR